MNGFNSQVYYKIFLITQVVYSKHDCFYMFKRQNNQHLNRMIRWCASGRVQKPLTVVASSEGNWGTSAGVRETAFLKFLVLNTAPPVCITNFKKKGNLGRLTQHDFSWTGHLHSGDPGQMVMQRALHQG